MIELRDYLDKLRGEFGLDYSSTLHDVNEELRQLDIQARTFQGYEYATRELRKKAEEDDIALSKVCGDIDALTRSLSIKLISTLPEKQYTENILANYLDRLNKHVTEIDTQKLNSICGVIEECSEERCVELREIVSHEDCLEGVKESFLERIKNRIESIWSAEDGQIFDNILLTTDFNSPDSVKKNIEYIETSGRTENKKKYIDAIQSFNDENIKTAHDYYVLSQKSFLQKYLIQIAIIAISFILFFVLNGELLLLAGCIAGGVWLGKKHNKEKQMRDLWNTMTIDGTVIHSCLKE